MRTETLAQRAWSLSGHVFVSLNLHFPITADETDRWRQSVYTKLIKSHSFDYLPHKRFPSDYSYYLTGLMIVRLTITVALASLEVFEALVRAPVRDSLVDMMNRLASMRKRSKLFRFWWFVSPLEWTPISWLIDWSLRCYDVQWVAFQTELFCLFVSASLKPRDSEIFISISQTNNFRGCELSQE